MGNMNYTLMLREIKTLSIFVVLGFGMPLYMKPKGLEIFLWGWGFFDDGVVFVGIGGYQIVDVWGEPLMCTRKVVVVVGGNGVAII